jgi:prepilin-type N-terminal cleavage/methylation domain-containing protein
MSALPLPAPHPLHRCRPGYAADAGFTLLELVVAVVVLSTGFVMAAMTNTTTMKMMIRDLTMSDQESLIDEDLAKIHQKAEEFTWCSGEGTQGSDGSSCATSTPLAKNFYFPNFPPSSDETFKAPPPRDAITRFEEACNGSGLTDGLIDQIGRVKQLQTADKKITIVRTAALANPTPNPSAEFGVSRQTHLLRITYRKMEDDMMAPSERDVDILPVVAAWCP